MLASLLDFLLILLGTSPFYMWLDGSTVYACIIHKKVVRIGQTQLYEL